MNEGLTDYYSEIIRHHRLLLYTEPNLTRIAGRGGEKARPRLRNHQRVRTPACSDSDALAAGLDAPSVGSFRLWRWGSVE